MLAIVLEKGSAEKYPCNSRFTGGTYHVAMNDIMAGEKPLFSLIEKATGGAARPGLSQAVAEDAERAVRWLQGEGLRFMKASASPHHQWVLAPPGRTRPGLDWEGRAGDVLLRTLEQNLVKRGGQLVRGAAVRNLLMEEGRCVGVKVEEGGAVAEYRARAVVIADGGFQGNEELVRKHISGQPAKLKQRGAGTGIGDGLRMATAAGAAVSDLNRFYGHLLSRDAFAIPTLWPYPYLDALAAAAVVIDSQGNRFTDEGRGGVYVANAIAGLADPLSAAIIFDEAIWAGPGRTGLIPPNSHVPAEGGTLHRAATIMELAQLLEVPPDQLGHTIGEYNEALRQGQLGSLRPARTEIKGRPWPIAAPPFYAAPICAGITYTMGGILIDEYGRVAAESGGIVNGLYAAGASTGGLEGGPQVGYVGGLVKGTVFGLRSAEHIAETFDARVAAASADRRM